MTDDWRKMTDDIVDRLLAWSVSGPLEGLLLDAAEEILVLREALAMACEDGWAEGKGPETAYAYLRQVREDR